MGSGWDARLKETLVRGHGPACTRGPCRSMAGAGLLLMRARRSHGQLVLDNLSEPSALWASWGGPGPRVANAGCRRGSKLRVRRPLHAVSLVTRLQSQLTRFLWTA